VQVSFDRAADYYDATRALPGAAAAALAGVLAGELAGRGRCLEIGVGTGRIALPLHDRGIELIGADIAPAMLARLVANSGGTAPFPLLLADATALPLADGSVGAVLASHVLHLIEDWRCAVDESLRVLAPAGALLADFGGLPPAPWGEMVGDVLREHGLTWYRPGVSAATDVAAYLGQRAAARPLTPVTMSVWRSPEQVLRDMENQIYSWTWPYRAEQLRRAASEIRDRAADAGLALAQPVGHTRTIQWWAFDRR
jgi:SAM-dependent methyltransferase